MTRLFLILVVLMLGVFGVGFLVAPSRFAALVGLRMDTTTAISDVRAVYGGFEIGMAVLLIWCMLDPARMRLALGVTAVMFGAVAASRMVGMLLDKPVTSMTWKIAAVEAVTALIAVVLVWRES
ncbi:MAG: DUF4345 domain-containing protein [Gemmatimonadota bacterium]|nr:DUF4345 domain-containing protein [Gemmatimonadota bacterium]